MSFFIVWPGVFVVGEKAFGVVGFETSGFLGFLDLVLDSGSKIIIGGWDLDSKNFLEGSLAKFLEWGFGLEFKDPRGFWGIRRAIAEIWRVCQICPATVKIKLNCSF